MDKLEQMVFFIYIFAVSHSMDTTPASWIHKLLRVTT